jgi:phosphoglycerate dehydrogenase-like enzyme
MRNLVSFPAGTPFCRHRRIALTPHQSIRTSELILGTLSIAGQEGRRLRVKEQAEKSKAQNQARKRRN